MIAYSTILYAPGFEALMIERSEAVNPFLTLWSAVKTVESSNNCDTINLSEGAYGCGQIRQPMLDDYNLANGTSLTLSDCLNEAVSRKVFIWHCMKFKSLEVAAKRWNGSGPATEIYWNKILKFLV